MVRRYAEAVQVRAGHCEEAGREAGRPAGPGVPSAFVWRGRRYEVRAVVGHWRERRAWWTGAAALALHGAGPEPVVPGSDPGALGDLDGEREVWRVEASTARGDAPGIYDLAHDSTGRLTPEPAGATGAWRLLRVAD